MNENMMMPGIKLKEKDNFVVFVENDFEVIKILTHF
jgi:hypothetical protein